MTTAALTWQPSLSAFMRRTVIMGAMTLALMVLAGWIIGVTTGFWQVLYAGPVLALVYNILFEDPLRWRRTRQDRWRLEQGAVSYQGPEGDSRIALADIEKVVVRWCWTVVIFLKGGKRVRMAYVNRPYEIARRILDARDRQTA